MATAYPKAVDTASPVNGNTSEEFNAAVVAAETKLGKSSASAVDIPAASTVLYSDATGASKWSGAPVVTSVTAKEYIGTAQALGTTGTVSVDPTVGNVLTCTPTGAITFNAATAPKCGVTFVVTTSGTSAFVLTFGTNFKSTGTLSTGTVDAKVFTVSFQGDGTNLNEVSRTTAM